MSDTLLDVGEPGEREGLTPDEQALFRRLEADGAAWRAGSQGVESLGAQLQQRAQRMSALQAAADDTRQTQTYVLDDSSLAHTRSEGAASMSHGRLRRFGAVAAALVVVGGLAALLLSAAPGRFRSSPAAPVATRTSVAQTGTWVDLSQLDYSPAFNANNVPAMAPSDPRVVYETLAQDGKGWGNQPAQLRRTDDEGATWHMLPLPVPADHIAGAGVAVSPINARTVFLTLVEYTAADCLADHAQPITTPGDTSVYCWLQFTSTDGGVHWTATRLPLANGTASGVLTSSVTDGHAGPMTSGALSAQGTRLYAGFGCNDAPCTRLVTSTDGGLSWQFADQPLLPSAANICDYTNTPTGSTVFAVTTPVTTSWECNVSDQHPLTLWRSDDAGAHWTSLGTLATPNERGIKVAIDPATGRPLLYLILPRTTAMVTDKMGINRPQFSSDPSDVKVSADGGRTWSAAPLAGIPADHELFGSAGILPDGSVAALIIPKGDDWNTGLGIGGTLYTWKPGESAWRQLAPPIANELGSLLVTPSRSGGVGTLWVIQVNRNNNVPADIFTFERDIVSAG